MISARRPLLRRHGYFRGRREVPHPTQCFLQRLTLTRARERVRNKAFIRATGYPSEPFDQGLASARAEGWRVYEIACGHDIMLDMPERLAELLQGLSR